MKFDSRINKSPDLFLSDPVVRNLASETEGHQVLALLPYLRLAKSRFAQRDCTGCFLVEKCWFLFCQC